MRNQLFRQAILLTFCLLTFNFLLQAQPPLRFSYQSIIRNAGGQALNNQAVSMRLSILQGGDNGTAVYVETHSGNTNAQGLISLQIGGGIVVSGSISGIDWAAGPYFIKTETDPEGGSNYSITGTSPLLSVPYAMHANTSGSAANGVPAGGSHGQVLTLCNGVLTWTTGGVCPSNLPTLTTMVASAITSTSASSGGNITNDGGSSITVRGVCWSTSQNPTIALSTKTNDGTGSGSFSSSLSGLSPNTLYYVRAYATNSAGTAYGNQVTITTSASVNPIDVDGNEYTTVIIGTQIWMRENLKVTRYNNGDLIPKILNDIEWQNTGNGAYSIYNNSIALNNVYGKFYNWFAITDSRKLCPVGWHVPSDHEWNILTFFLDPISDTACFSCGASLIVGGKLKSTGTIQTGNGLWNTPNEGATNSTEFSGLPGGLRSNAGPNYDLGFACHWWSTTAPENSNGAWARSLSYNSAGISRGGLFKNTGVYVRCIKD